MYPYRTYLSVPKYLKVQTSMGRVVFDLLVLGGHLRADGQHGRLLVALHPASVQFFLLLLDPLALDHLGAVAGHRARPLIRTSHRRRAGWSSVGDLAFSLLTSIGGRPDVSPSLHSQSSTTHNISSSCSWLAERRRRGAQRDSVIASARRGARAVSQPCNRF